MKAEFIIKKRILEYTDETVYLIGIKDMGGGVRNELLAAFTGTGIRCYEKLKTYKSTINDGLTSVTLFKDKTEIEDFCNFLNGALILNMLKGE